MEEAIDMTNLAITFQTTSSCRAKFLSHVRHKTIVNLATCSKNCKALLEDHATPVC